MKNSLLFGIFLNFLGACYETGQVVKGNILHPTADQNEAASIACIFLLGMIMGFGVYHKLQKKLIQKTGS